MNRVNRSYMGFDRKVDRALLDAAAGHAAAQTPLLEARAALARLMGEGIGKETRDKGLSILARLWLVKLDPVSGLRQRAQDLFPTVRSEERLALHWALLCAVYPFFQDAAYVTGRLLGLQGEVGLQQVQRRMTERWGDRPTLPRALQRVLRSMIEWGVLVETSKKGVYGKVEPVPVSAAVGSLVVEGLLHGQETTAIPLDSLHQHPALFPFDLAVTGYDLRQSVGLEVYRQGVDMEMVTLRR
jgi:hypothetical protein